MPGAVAEKAEVGKLRVRIRWRGMPRLGRAKTSLIRGFGYDTTPVMLPKQPSLEILAEDGQVLWIAH
jgi:hypothetical protein